MCWPHVQRDCENHAKTIRPKEMSEDIMSDISLVQLSQSRDEFDQANLLLFTKWFEEENESVHKFLDYYRKQWVVSNESNWFAGAGPIDHNNGLEATNADIKQNKVLRNKQQIGSFMVNALEIVKKFTLKDDSRLFCSRADLLDLKMKTEGFQWMMLNQKEDDILRVRNKIYILSSHSQKKGDKLKEKANEYISRFKKKDFASFEQFKDLKTSVYELEEDDDFYICNCPIGLKKYLCKHAIGLAIKLKNFQIPETAMSVPLAEKRTRGRPKKNRGWWSHE